MIESLPEASLDVGLITQSEVTMEEARLLSLPEGFSVVNSYLVRRAMEKSAASPVALRDVSLALSHTCWRRSDAKNIVEYRDEKRFEFGSWIFGGLIAFTLLVMASLLTIGPVDPAIMTATVAFALALPLDVTGLLLLRLIQDLKHVGFEEELAQAFQEVGFTFGEPISAPTALQTQRKRRTGVVLSYTLGIVALSSLLTLTGMTATLWHMAWWIGVSFLAMVLLSPVILIAAIVSSEPPDSAEEKELKRRYREEMTRQAKAQYQKKE